MQVKLLGNNRTEYNRKAVKNKYESEFQSYVY